MKVVAIITARKGSKRLKNKNKLILGNKPLISWTIDFAKKIKFINDIIMTTDDVDILNISKKKNILAPWIRPKRLSEDGTSSYLTVKHAVRWYEKNYSKIDCICLLQPTSPFRLKQNMVNAFNIFKKKKESVISVMPKKIKNPFSLKNEKNKSYNLYIPSGSFFFISPKELNKYRNFINKVNNLYLVSNVKENIDINDIKDLNNAKAML
jgi:CMP-N,N'-diacetyllegionaminic acid synthase